MDMPIQKGTHNKDVEDAQMVPLSRLTAREREVLKLLVAGKTNKEIAWILQITVHTAKMHVSHILAKLQVSSRMEAALLYIRSGTSKGKE